MAEIVVVDLPGPEAERLLAAVEATSVRASVDELGTVLDDRTLAVITGGDGGIGVAQRAHQEAPDAAVVLVATSAEGAAQIGAELGITPAIGRHTLCVAADDPSAGTSLAQEVDLARRRVAHRRTMSAIALGSPQEGIASDRVSDVLGRLFEHAPICVLMCDLDGVVRAANPCCTEMLGWQPRNAIGIAFPRLFGGVNAGLAADLITDTLASGEPAVETLERTGPDGSAQHVEVTVTAVDPDRPEQGLFVLLRDDTSRVHALEVNEQARRAAEEAAQRYATLAQTLQESLLPPGLPTICGVRLASRFRPAGDGSEIGGDFFDIFQVPSDEGEHWVAAVGDVCGKGAGAARLTALTRYTLRATSVRLRDLEQNLRDLNAALSRQYELDRVRGEHRFVTAAVLRFTADDGGVRVRAGSAGHAPPLIVRVNGDVEPIPCRGPLLGTFPTGTWTAASASLGPGDLVVMYTDGVTEASRHGQLFGEERLLELLSHCAGRTADEAAEAIEAAVLRYQTGLPRDDVAIFVIGAEPRP